MASTAMVEPITRRFVESIEGYVRDNKIPMITFEKGQRKDDIAKQRRAAFTQEEGAEVHRLSHRETPQPANAERS